MKLLKGVNLRKVTKDFYLEFFRNVKMAARSRTGPNSRTSVFFGVLALECLEIHCVLFIMQ